MNRKQKIVLENESEIKEEKKINFTKILVWGIGLLITFMAIAYFAGLTTFGTREEPSDEAKKAYTENDSIATANAPKIDTTLK